jgi:hydroxypyruvate isomerase
LDLEQEVDRRAALLSHVHIADVPGRHEPGSGSVNFEKLELALRRVGYGGYLGCEYSPASSTEAGLGWLRRKIQPGIT